MATTICGLPVFEVLLEDAEGMFCISLVDYPAVEKNFLAFDKDKQVIKFAVADEDKHLLRGVVMRANYPIYRSDNNGEYWITFSPATIRTMAEKYLSDGLCNEFSCQHDGHKVDGVKMVQWYIKDTANGINPVGFEDIEEGSLFGEFEVEDSALWERIKEGELKGFSIECAMNIQATDKVVSTEKIPAEYINWLSDFVNQSKISMSKIKATLTKLIGKFGSVTTDGGILVWDGDDALAEGVEVFIEDGEGDRNPAPDGEYKVEDGKTISVVDGKVTAIAEPEPEPVENNLADVEASITALEERISALESRLADIEGQFAEFKKTPAGAPAHEAFKADPSFKSCGNAKYDEFAQKMQSLRK